MSFLRRSLGLVCTHTRLYSARSAGTGGRGLKEPVAAEDDVPYSATEVPWSVIERNSKTGSSRGKQKTVEVNVEEAMEEMGPEHPDHPLHEEYMESEDSSPATTCSRSRNRAAPDEDAEPEAPSRTRTKRSTAEVTRNQSVWRSPTRPARSKDEASKTPRARPRDPEDVEEPPRRETKEGALPKKPPKTRQPVEDEDVGLDDVPRRAGRVKQGTLPKKPPKKKAALDSSESEPKALRIKAAKPPKKARVRKEKRARAILLPDDPLEDNPFFMDSRAISESMKMEELEILREEPANATSTTFTKKYNALRSSLTSTFTEEQLEEFARSYGLNLRPKVESPKFEEPADAPARKRKGRSAKFLSNPESQSAYFASQIMEQKWGWESVKRIEQKFLDKEPVTQRISFNPTEFCLVLGKNGTNLLALRKTHRVKFSTTEHPMELEFQGTRSDVRKLEEHLATMKQNTLEKTLPAFPQVHLGGILESITRFTGAHLVSAVQDNKPAIRISATDRATLNTAERLATRASLEGSSVDTITCYIPHSPTEGQVSTYSLYPFLLSRPSPWKVKMNRAFRMRRVSEWLGGVSEDVHLTGGLVSGKGQLVDIAERPLGSLAGVLTKHLPSLPVGVTRSITATTGHALLSPEWTPFPSILPPIARNSVLSKVFDWFTTKKASMTFSPGIPTTLLSTVGSPEASVARLSYASIGESTHSQPTIKCEVSMDQALASARCWAGVQKNVSLVLPARSMDLRISVFDSTELSAEGTPTELQDYIVKLQNFGRVIDEYAPLAPLHITHQGMVYALLSNSVVTVSREEIPAVPLTRFDVNDIDDNGRGIRLTTITREEAHDVETLETTQSCTVECTDMTDEPLWMEFLQKCDRLTTMGVIGGLGAPRLDASWD